MELTWEKVNALGQENFKNFIRRYLAKNGIFCTGNDAETDAVEAYEENGLIQGHAYSLLSWGFKLYCKLESVILRTKRDL